MSRVKKILKGIVESDRVAGAYLFLGPPGVGKEETAEEFAQLLESKKQDKIVISPTGASLKIDQVRELQKWVRFGPSASKYLIAIVEAADTLTDQAAAAFLKTLEEPAPGVVFVLLVERADKLPGTILSRCQKIVFSEKRETWQPNQDFNAFYDEMKSIKNKGWVELLQLSARLEKEKERIDELLYDLVHFVRYKMGDTAAARIILDTLRYIKRRANLKLSLDIMCLRLGANNV